MRTLRWLLVLGLIGLIRLIAPRDDIGDFLRRRIADWARYAEQEMEIRDAPKDKAACDT